MPPPETKLLAKMWKKLGGGLAEGREQIMVTFMKPYSIEGMRQKKSRPKLPPARDLIEAAARSGKGVSLWQRIIHPRTENHHFEIVMEKNPGKSPVNISKSRKLFGVKFYPAGSRTILHTHTRMGNGSLAGPLSIRDIKDVLSAGPKGTRQVTEIVSEMKDGTETKRYFFRTPKNVEEAKKKLNETKLQYKRLSTDLARVYNESRTKDARKRIRKWFINSNIDFVKKLGFKVRVVKLPKK